MTATRTLELMAVLLGALAVFGLGWAACAWYNARRFGQLAAASAARPPALQVYPDEMQQVTRSRPGQSRQARYWPTEQGWAAAEADARPVTFTERPGQVRYWPTPQAWADWDGSQDRQYVGGDVFTRRAREIANAGDQIATLRAEVWAERWRNGQDA